MQGVHGRGSEVLSECCTIVYRANSATIKCTVSSAHRTAVFFAGEPMKRSDLNGLYIMGEFCDVRYSPTSAEAQSHNFNGFLHCGSMLLVEGS